MVPPSPNCFDPNTRQPSGWHTGCSITSTTPKTPFRSRPSPPGGSSATSAKDHSCGRGSWLSWPTTAEQSPRAAGGRLCRRSAATKRRRPESPWRPAIILPWLRTGQRMDRNRHAWALAVIAVLLVVAFVAALVSVRGFHISAPTPAGHNVGKSDPWIVYQWVSPKSDYVTTLYLVRPDGSGLHTLLPDSIWSRYSPAWSPDGQRIAFTADRGDRSDLWIVNADGSGARRIVSCDEPCNTVKSADWSPDGRRILFTQDDLPAGPGGV